jgi:hypothetical protein
VHGARALAVHHNSLTTNALETCLYTMSDPEQPGPILSPSKPGPVAVPPSEQ